MSANHAFYIPDAVYCVDVPGLLQHIGEDVLLGNICLWCSHGFGGLVTGSESDRELVKRARRGAEAVRKHMVDKGHCRIPWDTENQRLAYSDYYDFTSSYPAGEGDDDDEEERDGMDVDAQDWEDEDGSDVDSDDEVVMDYSAIKKKKKTRRPEEEELDYRLAVGEADYELVLPSGTRIGHRALKGVYKQNVMRELTRSLAIYVGPC
jgi:pre-60S factor REI1